VKVKQMNNFYRFLSALALSGLLAFCPSSWAQSPSNDNNFEQLLQQHQGKVIYLDFWASWCGPCRKSFPWMNSLQKKYSADDFIVLSVNVDNDRTLAEEFLKVTPANFSIYYDPKGQVARKYRLKGMPSSFLIDKTGKTVSAHVGFTVKKQQQYQAEIDALLAASNVK
jgi:thiol-disulfide isomerase/thioredoxin